MGLRHEPLSALALCGVTDKVPAAPVSSIQGLSEITCRYWRTTTRSARERYEKTPTVVAPSRHAPMPLRSAFFHTLPWPSAWWSSDFALFAPQHHSHCGEQHQGQMYEISQKSPLVAPMFDFKIGFLAKFCVIEGISEIMYIHTYDIFLVSVGSYVRWLYPQG